MDVRGVLRRSRLSLVASLFLAALLGGPTVAVTGPVAVGGPVAVPAAMSITTVAIDDGVAATRPVSDPVAAGTADARPVPVSVEIAAGSGPAARPFVVPGAAGAAVPPRSTRLTSQTRAAVAGPRAPPAVA